MRIAAVPFLLAGLWLIATPVHANDCTRAAERARAETGGEVLSVAMRKRDGRTVCIVTVLVPGRDGERPRRETLVLPA